MSIEGISIKQKELDFAEKNHLRQETVKELEDKDDKYSSEFYNSFENILADLELPEEVIDEKGDVLEDSMQKILKIFQQIDKAKTNPDLKKLEKWSYSPSSISKFGAFNCTGASFLLCSLLKEKYNLKDVYIGNPIGHAITLLKNKNNLYYLDARNNILQKLEKEDYQNYPPSQNGRLQMIRLQDNKTVSGFNIIPYYLYLTDGYEATTRGNNEELNRQKDKGVVKDEDYQAIVQSYGEQEFQDSLEIGEDITQLVDYLEKTEIWQKEKDRVGYENFIRKNIDGVLRDIISKNPENKSTLFNNESELRGVLKDIFKCENVEEFEILINKLSDKDFGKLFLESLSKIDTTSFFKQIKNIKIVLHKDNMDEEVDKTIDEIKKLVKK